MVFAPVWQLKVAVKYWPGAVLKAGHDYLHSSRQHNSSINAVVKCGFPRKLRLLTSTAFDAVFQQPCRAASGQLTLLGRVNGLNHPRIGIIIAKKQVKCASRRNRLKRLLRESFRQHQSRLPAMDFLAIAKKGIETLDNRALIQMLETLWKRHCRSI